MMAKRESRSTRQRANKRGGMGKRGISCRRRFWMHTFSLVASTQPCCKTPVEGDLLARNTACGFHGNKIGSPLVRLPRCAVFLADRACLVSRLMRSVCYRDSELYIELSVQNTLVQYQYRNQKSIPMETCICAGGMS